MTEPPPVPDGLDDCTAVVGLGCGSSHSVALLGERASPRAALVCSAPGPVRCSTVH